MMHRDEAIYARSDARGDLVSLRDVVEEIRSWEGSQPCWEWARDYADRLRAFTTPSP